MIKEINKRHISFEISLIYGLPLQTPVSFQKSIDFCQTLEVPNIQAFPLMLLRGTKLHQQRKQLGLISSFESEKLDKLHYDISHLPPFPYVIETPSFSFQDWLEMREIANKLLIDNNNKQEQTIEIMRP